MITSPVILSTLLPAKVEETGPTTTEQSGDGKGVDT